MQTKVLEVINDIRASKNMEAVVTSTRVISSVTI